MDAVQRVLICSTVFLWCNLVSTASEVLIITGVYTGKNLYVQNPILPDNGFSTKEVFVNESLVLSNPLTSAYTIDLSHLNINQSVEVKIIHREGFRPKIVNSQVIRDRQVITAESYAPTENVFRWINVDGTTIRWLTHGEKGGGIFEIQKAHMEEWMPLDTIATNIDTESVYRYTVTHDKGDNTYRIKLIDRDGYVTYSNLINYKSR